MSALRFGLGDLVMCNLGPNGWKLGRIIALHYREDHWPDDDVAPYQIAIEEDHALIYAPEDDDDYCRVPTPEDLRIARCADALAPSPTGQGLDRPSDENQRRAPTLANGLRCDDVTLQSYHAGYRDGRCQGCNGCPQTWSNVELYSEHYRCAKRNGLNVRNHAIDLGEVKVGETVRFAETENLPIQKGFMQSPTLVRLPPGVVFSDDGTLEGKVSFDPHREVTYRVDFVAVSTADWNDPTVGLVRLEITFVVEENRPPSGFDVDAFGQDQQRAISIANRIYDDLGNTWQQWEAGKLANAETCERMCGDLERLRRLLREHPRLEGGWWWAQLGGYYMNVHKLLENTLFECELYLGHALTFGDSRVRWLAEQNLAGCYQKRLLEAARFMWIDGVRQMMNGEWAAAAETIHRAAAKKDGWGWAVNFGDIWFSE
ncbi:MAG: hypothetical protein AAFP69_22330, partial [Planctomycetota bacterium]